VAVATLTVIAGFLRIWNSAGPSFRLDEGFSIRWAAAPLTGHGHVQSLIQIVASDVHPPGYFLMLHVWMQAFGANLTLLRLPSEIAGTLAVPALYLLGTSLYGRVVGLYAALFGAFSPFWIWHSQEARMYTFLLLFTILSSYFFVQALKYRHAWAWLGYAVASLLAIYFQYYAFLVLLVHFIFLVSHWRHYSARLIGAWFGVMVLCAAVYAPWVYAFVTNYKGASDPDLTAPNLYTPLTTLSTFLFGYLSTPITSNVIAAWPLLVVLSLALGIFAAALSRRASFLWLLLLLPVVLSFVVTLYLRPVLSVRYLIIVTPALYILLAIPLARIRGIVANLATAVVLAGLLVVAWQVEEVDALNPQNENFRAAVTYIEQHARPGDAVALDSFYNQDAFSYYSHINLPIYALPALPAPGTGAVPHARAGSIDKYITSIMAGEKHLWVLYYLESNYDPNNLVRHYLAYHTAGHQVIFGGPYGRNQSRWSQSFRDVQLTRYDLIPSAAAAEQTRPETIQVLRAISSLSPVLRQPFRSSFGRQGASTAGIGPVIAPAPTAWAWHFPALTGSATSSHVTVTNPNYSPVTATVTAGGVSSRRLTIPPASSVDVDIATLSGSPQSTVSISANGSVTAQRNTMSGRGLHIMNGFHGAGL
jgi:hypothetical protein